MATMDPDLMKSVALLLNDPDAAATGVVELRYNSRWAHAASDWVLDLALEVGVDVELRIFRIRGQWVAADTVVEVAFESAEDLSMVAEIAADDAAASSISSLSQGPRFWMDGMERRRLFHDSLQSTLDVYRDLNAIEDAIDDAGPPSLPANVVGRSPSPSDPTADSATSKSIGGVFEARFDAAVSQLAAASRRLRRLRREVLR